MKETRLYNFADEQALHTEQRKMYEKEIKRLSEENTRFRLDNHSLNQYDGRLCKKNGELAEENVKLRELLLESLLHDTHTECAHQVAVEKILCEGDK